MPDGWMWRSKAVQALLGFASRTISGLITIAAAAPIWRSLVLYIGTTYTHTHIRSLQFNTNPRSFSIDDLHVLLKHATIKPVVNQILLHPYVIKSTTPLLEYMKEHHIVPEGYSTLIPITSKPGGPVDKPIGEIANRLGKKPEQILLAWSKAKQ
jgi:hypothetical protein